MTNTTAPTAPILFNGLPLDRDLFAPAEAAVYEYEEEAHCFVCGRHTDHAGEHDDLGDFVVYDRGSVRWAEGVDRHKAMEALDLAHGLFEAWHGYCWAFSPWYSEAYA